MKKRTLDFFEDFFARHSAWSMLREPISGVIEVLVECFENGGKLLLCGNGGSSADCDHIAGEMMKGFLLKRQTSDEFRGQMDEMYGEDGKKIAEKLQVGLPTISLNTHAAAISAFSNDVDAELVYAEQTLGYGKPGDVLIGISTSGNAKNVAAAVKVANCIGMTTVGLTGKDGGMLAKLADMSIVAPETETYRVQECHLAVYHLICACVEFEMFDY